MARIGTNVIGEKYGQMTIISDAPRRGNNVNRRVFARCTCGTMSDVLLGSLRTGATTSCGCHHKQVVTTHGETHTEPLYRVWAAMKNRCNDPNAQKYADYGGRGIKVCPEWDTYGAFKAWANTTYIKGMSLDRENNDLGYNPNNCRWVDKTTQSRNTRSRKGSTSQYVGVHWCKTTQKWGSIITVNKKKKNLGLFATELEAAIKRERYIISEGLKDFTLNNV